MVNIFARFLNINTTQKKWMKNVDESKTRWNEKEMETTKLCRVEELVLKVCYVIESLG